MNTPTTASPAAACASLSEAATRLVTAIRVRHYSYRTEQCYVGWLYRYRHWLTSSDGLPHRLADSTVKVRAYLAHLATVEHVAGKTQNQAFAALVFFYEKALEQPLGDLAGIPRAKTYQRLPTILSREQVAAMLGAYVDTPAAPYRLIASLFYYCGLRLTEGLELRVKDISFADSTLTVVAGKGAKDRRVPIPCALIPQLRAQVLRARALHAADTAARIPVALPTPVANKYPRYAYAPAWAYLFAAPAPCLHPRTRARVRWRLHDESMQRATREAAARVDLTGLVTPHVFRHAYATQLLGAGVDIRNVQDLLGHKDVETTMIYTHTAPARSFVRNAIDALAPAEV